MLLTPTAPTGFPPTPPSPRHWTNDELARLADAGVFAGERIMLLDGVIYDMPVANPLHDIGVEAAYHWLSRAFAGRAYVRNQMGFHAGTASNPAPDLAVVPGSYLDYRRQHPSEALLIVEVADSSLGIDTGKKAELYAAAGVEDYWVLDIARRQIHLFRDPLEGSYQTHRILNPTEPVAPLACPEFTATAAELLPDQ
jgi:Uma2 family endonuclease